MNSPSPSKVLQDVNPYKSNSSYVQPVHVFTESEKHQPDDGSIENENETSEANIPLVITEFDNVTQIHFLKDSTESQIEFAEKLAYSDFDLTKLSGEIVQANNKTEINICEYSKLVESSADVIIESQASEKVNPNIAQIAENHENLKEEFRKYEFQTPAVVESK